MATPSERPRLLHTSRGSICDPDVIANWNLYNVNAPVGKHAFRILVRELQFSSRAADKALKNKQMLSAAD